MSTVDDDPTEWGTDAYERWSDEAHRIAARVVRDANNAPDIAQRALKKLVMLHPKPRNVAAWLTTTIRNLSIDAHRRDAVRPQQPDDDLARRPAARTVASGVVERAGIRDVLDGLPDQHRRALLLTAAGYSNAEIAEELGFASAASVAATLSRLRRQLRERRDLERAEPRHPSGDSETNQGPQTPESVSVRQGVRMADIPAEVVKRIRREPEPGLPILEGSTPVVFFGNQPDAKFASVGINPSSAEFKIRGQLLQGDARRFETLESLGIESLDEVTDDHVEAIYNRCLNYFKDPETDDAPRSTAYWDEWFVHLEGIIGALTGDSYLSGTACHIDLVQWATWPNWSHLNKRDRDRLLEHDLDFLRTQLQNDRLETIYLNGRSVLEQFRKALPEVRLIEHKCAISGLRGRTTFVRGRVGQARIIGSSFNAKNSWLEKGGQRSVALGQVLDELRRMLGLLDQ